MTLPNETASDVMGAENGDKKKDAPTPPSADEQRNLPADTVEALRREFMDVTRS